MREKSFALSLGLPEDATADCARVTLSGQSAALVEGQHGVIELTESRVRLRTGRGVLTVLFSRMPSPPAGERYVIGAEEILKKAVLHL